MDHIVKIFKKVLKNSKIKPRDFYMTLRRILTGKDEGPELVNIIPILGKEVFMRRLERALGGGT